MGSEAKVVRKMLYEQKLIRKRILNAYFAI